MPKYPTTSFSSYNIPWENGSAVYAIWRKLAPDNLHVAGYISRTKHKTWQIDLATRHYGQQIKEFVSFKDAKQAAKELLA